MLCMQQFQRNIVRSVENFVSISTKQMELGGSNYFFCLFNHQCLIFSLISILSCPFFMSLQLKFVNLNFVVKKLAEDCCRYGNENQSSSFALANASFQFGTSYKSIEEERENLIKILDSKVIFLPFSLHLNICMEFFLFSYISMSLPLIFVC